MPRKDKTFSDRDLIRIYEDNLTSKEQQKVRDYILLDSLAGQEEWSEDICESFFELLGYWDLSMRYDIRVIHHAGDFRRVTMSLLKMAEQYEWIPFLGEELVSEMKTLNEWAEKTELASRRLAEEYEQVYEMILAYVQNRCAK